MPATYARVGQTIEGNVTSRDYIVGLAPVVLIPHSLGRERHTRIGEPLTSTFANYFERTRPGLHFSSPLENYGGPPMPRVSQSSSGKRFHCPLFIGGKKCEASYPIRGNLNRHLRDKHGCRTSKRRAIDSGTSTMKMASPLDGVPEATGPSQSTTDPSPATAYSNPPLLTFDGLFSTLDDSPDRNHPPAPLFDVDACASPYPFRLSSADGYAPCPVPVAPGATSYHQGGLTPPHLPTAIQSTLASTTSTNLPIPPLPYGARSAWLSAGATVSQREEFSLPSDFSWMVDDRFDLATSNSANVMDDTPALSGLDAHPSVTSRHLTELSAVSNCHPMAHPSSLARAPPDYTHSLRSEALWLARIKEAYHEEQDADELPQQLQIDSAQGWTLGPQEQMSHEECLEQTLGMTGAWQGQETSSWSQRLDAAQEQYAPMQQPQDAFASTHCPVDLIDFAAQQAAYSPIWSDLFLSGSLEYQVHSREGPPTVFDSEEALELDAFDPEMAWAFDAQQDPYAMHGRLEHMLEVAAASDHGRVYDTMI